MNYERNKIYFFPIRAKYKKELRFGCAPFVTIGIGVLILMSPAFPLGLLAIMAGGAWIAIVASITATSNKEIDEFNKNRTIITDAEIDQACKNHLKTNLKSMALRKLGIKEDQVQENEPICFEGYYYKELPGMTPVKRKRGDDGKFRSSNYNVVMFFFSTEQVFCYQLRFSLLSNEKQETTNVCFYRDIVGVATRADAIPFDDSTINFEEYTLTNAGGGKIDVTIFDAEIAQSSLNAMNDLLTRQRIQQSQR